MLCEIVAEPIPVGTGSGQAGLSQRNSTLLYREGSVARIARSARLPLSITLFNGHFELRWAQQINFRS
jgi:hypothetical protein